MTIDRIDNNGPYSKENCKWSSAKTQARNRSTTKWITIGKETKSLAHWCEVTGLNYDRVYRRIQNLKWPPIKALELLADDTNNKGE